MAAFLTIVGFSVNDTVVTFDRIRELRGKAPRVTGRMIDDAVNQTLSRTWRTSATALMTVVVLFVFNVGQRSVLEGLSFTLMVGMVAGVYSTVAVAAPLLLFLPWFWAKIKHWRPRASVFTWALSAAGHLGASSARASRRPWASRSSGRPTGAWRPSTASCACRSWPRSGSGSPGRSRSPSRPSSAAS